MVENIKKKADDEGKSVKHLLTIADEGGGSKGLKKKLVDILYRKCCATPIWIFDR